MKISVDIYTIAERFGDIKAIEMIKEAGFDAIDYSYCDNKDCETVLGDNYREYATKIREHLDKNGIVCNQAHAPYSLEYGVDFCESDVKYRSVLRAIESASILGAQTIVIHSVTVPVGVDFEQYNIDFYRSFIPYCQKFGICVAVENLFYRDIKRKRLIGKLGSPAELNAMVSKINSPWIVTCVDIGHAALTGYEPEDFIEAITPGSLRALHVQDNDYLDDRHVLPYSGQLNWEAIMRSLRAYGYTGDLTFEILKYFDGYPDELLPTVLKFCCDIAKHLVSIYND